MTSSINLSSSMSFMLQSLADINASIEQTTARLTTGKEVNNASDNPGVFFQAQSMTLRATAIDSLTNAMTVAGKALQAASNGLDSIAKQLDGLSNTLKSAQNQGSAPLSATAVSTQTFASMASNLAGSDANPAQFNNGDTFVISLSSPGAAQTINNSQQFYFRVINTAPPAPAQNGNGLDSNSPVQVRSVADLAAALQAANFGTDANGNKVSVNATIDGGRLAISAGGTSDMMIGLVTNGANTATNDPMAMFAGANQSKTDFVFKTGGIQTTGTAAVFSASTLGSAGIRQRQTAYDAYLATLGQITAMAGDASVPGANNLLQADKSGSPNMLSVNLNETGTATLRVQLNGASDANGLGLQGSYASRFMSDSDLDSAWRGVMSSIDIVKSRQGVIANNQSLLSSRVDFNKDLKDLLNQTAADLTAADTTTEAANLSQLQTRQQMAIKVMASSTQRDQMLLNLM